MEKSKSTFGWISIILGIIGIATIHIAVGIPIAIIGMIFGYFSCGYTDKRLTYAEVFLNNIAIVWLAIICIIGGKQ